MPDISTIDGTDITLLSNFQGVALTSGSLINGQTVSLVNSTYDEIYSMEDFGSLGLSSITIDNTILTTDYKTYDIFISGVSSSISSSPININTGSSGSVYWSDTASAFSTATSSGSETLQSVSLYGDYGFGTSARITLYDPANPNNDSRFYAESHQVWYSYTESYIKIMSGSLSTTNAATGITFSTTYGTFAYGNLVVYGIA